MREGELPTVGVGVVWCELLLHGMDGCHHKRQVEFPVLVRPSYVLSGAAMRVVTDPSDLKRYIRLSVRPAGWRERDTKETPSFV